MPNMDLKHFLCVWITTNSGQVIIFCFYYRNALMYMYMGLITYTIIYLKSIYVYNPIWPIH